MSYGSLTVCDDSFATTDGKNEEKEKEKKEREGTKKVE